MGALSEVKHHSNNNSGYNHTIVSSYGTIAHETSSCAKGGGGGGDGWRNLR